MHLKVVWLVLGSLFFIHFKSIADNSEIHSICQNQFELCLQRLPAEISRTEERSQRWYKLKTYQFDALYNVGLLKQARHELENTGSLENTPIEFQLSWTIHYAKILGYFKEHYKAQEHIKAGLALFEKLKASYASPNKLIELANLQFHEALAYRDVDNEPLFQEKLQETHETLEWIKENYNNVSDPKFHQSLNANFGHVAMNQKRFEQALQYNSKMLFWAKQSNNDHQISVANYNVARSAHELGDLERALFYYSEALALVENTDYEEQKLICYLRLLQINKLLGNQEQYQKFFKILESFPMDQFYSDMYQSILAN